jgi:hypothetical protein
MDVDTNRFPKIDSGFFQSPDFDSATNRAEINFEGGLGSVTVKVMSLRCHSCSIVEAVSCNIQTIGDEEIASPLRWLSNDIKF